MGVVMSGAVYLRFTGKTLVFLGAASRAGDMGRMPRPLDVVHSGNMRMTRLGLFLRCVSRSTIFAPVAGWSFG